MRSTLCRCGLLALFLISGCASDPSSSTGTRADTYNDSQSGAVFPKSVASLERVAVTNDSPAKGCVTVHYTATNHRDLEHLQLSFYLHADVSILPGYSVSPDKHVEREIQSCADKPNFTRETYRGTKTFGNQTASCAQCSFDRPVWNDRMTLKMLMIPHGQYCLLFTFGGTASQEENWQPVIDQFVQGILAGFSNQPHRQVAVGNPKLHFADYYAGIQQQLLSQWKQPTPRGGLELSTTVKIKIDRDGHISAVHLVQSSGDSVVDDSVLQAVQSVKQLPQPLASLGNADGFEVCLKFKLEP